MKGKIQQVEKSYQRSLKDVLQDMFEQHGSQRAVAEVLGVSQSTVHVWLLKVGLEQKTVLVERSA